MFCLFTNSGNSFAVVIEKGSEEVFKLCMWRKHVHRFVLHITLCGSPWLPADICQYLKKQTSSDTCWKSYDYTAYSQHNTTKHIVKELSQSFTTKAQNLAQVQTTQLSVTVIFLCSDVFEATL